MSPAPGPSSSPNWQIARQRYLPSLPGRESVVDWKCPLRIQSGLVSKDEDRQARIGDRAFQKGAKADFFHGLLDAVAFHLVYRQTRLRESLGREIGEAEDYRESGSQKDPLGSTPTPARFSFMCPPARERQACRPLVTSPGDGQALPRSRDHGLARTPSTFGIGHWTVFVSSSRNPVSKLPHRSRSTPPA